VNVIVVGSGVIGAATAGALASRGASVTVIDMRSPGRGASQASAGMLAPYVEGGHNPHLRVLGARSLAMFDTFVARLSDATGIKIEYARTGTLQIALDEDDAVRLHDAKAALSSEGAAVDWLDEEMVRDFEPSVTPAAIGGLFVEAHGFVGVQSLVAALVQHARFSGATFESPVEVVSIDARRGGVEVNAGTRKYSADVVVVAAGSWSRRVRVANLPALPMRPVRGQLLHLHWCEGELPQRIVWGPHCYTVPWSDGSLLVGATTEEVGFDEGTTVAGVHGLTSAAIELLPHASGARLEGVRVGLRPKLDDELPAIGPASAAPGVVFATGHYRNGVLLAPLTAEVVSRYVLEGISDPSFDVTSPDRCFRNPV